MNDLFVDTSYLIAALSPSDRNDAVSFAVMRRDRINDALAFDRDFQAAGFRTLIP